MSDVDGTGTPWPAWGLPASPAPAWSPPAQTQFVPGYAAPPGGMSAWTQPDGSAQPAAHIEARVELQLLERTGDWARIVCSNGWQAWVDGRLLAPVAPVAPAGPVATAMAPAVAPAAPVAQQPQPARTSALNPPITIIGSYTVTLADLVPAVGVVLGAMLPWVRGVVGRSTGFHVPLAFLTNTSAHKTGLSIGLLIALAALLALAAPVRGLRLVGYVVALAAFVGYVVQLQRLLNAAHAGGLGSALGAGVYVGIAFACLGIVRVLTSARSAAR